MNTQELQKLLETTDDKFEVMLKTVHSLTTDEIIDLLSNNKELLTTRKIEAYQLVMLLNDKQQLDIISHLKEMNLSIKEKTKILISVRDRVKEKADILSLPEEYKLAMKMVISQKPESYGSIVVDFNSNLEKYRGLDEMLYVDATNISNEERHKLMELVDICPQMNICSDMGSLFASNPDEYKKGEEWIQSVLDGIDSSWTDMQKIAYIDNKVGRKISYCPDFGTEACNINDARALWKIIDTGYGVCNGIAGVEQYMLKRVGIEAEAISSGRHVFLLLKGVEIPVQDGSKVGDTILDPTWNLMAHKFGAVPENFCKSYEEIREHDITAEGVDQLCHKNDEKLESVTLGLDRQKLREVFASIGIADKEGNFPVGGIIDASNNLAKQNLPEKEHIEKQFKLLADYYPEFAKSQNETASMLQIIMLNHDNLNFNKCVVNRVYRADDDGKRPVQYVYIDSKEAGRLFYYADKEGFIAIEQEKFEEKFNCYDEDLKRNNGKKPWENMVQNENDLNQSSGKISSKEEER